MGSERPLHSDIFFAGGCSFNDGCIRRRLPAFTMDCVPDFRQAIAASWPQRIDDHATQADWGWQIQYDQDAMVDDMLTSLQRQLTS